MFVGRNRFATACALLARHPQTQVIVCDDGLQHYGLYRDLEVCVFDDRACGNGWLLPAGPLREPWPRSHLLRAGQNAERLLVLHTGNHPAFEGYTAQRSLNPVGLRKDGSTVALSALVAPHARPLMAIAGIAQPENFFTMLGALGLVLASTLALRDHDNFESISGEAYQDYQLVCTEKDALKLWSKVPDAVAVPLIQNIEARFFHQLDTCIAVGLASALSFKHGHPTT
jgi:tetraacyldisaccharide 4'-kinase